MTKRCNIPDCEWFEQVYEELGMFSSIVLHGHKWESQKGEGIETDNDASTHK